MTLHYEIDGDDFSVAGEASSAVKKVLKKLSVDPDIIRRVAIAMYEAEINTVIHGGGGYADVDISTDSVKMVFADHGKGIADIEQAMQEGFSTATTKIRELGFGAGMGLPNMKKYTDMLELTSKVGVGTTVEMLVKIH
jgi:anti-sigma regulatory factor (Ser/Thr protein kinase)